MTTRVINDQDRLDVVRHLASGGTLESAASANRHLTSEQVRQIAASHGFPVLSRLVIAREILQRRADEHNAPPPPAEPAATTAEPTPPIDHRPLRGLVSVPVDDLHPSPSNPRERLTGINELAATMRSVGLIQPIVAQRLPDGRLQIVAGHRRHAAAKALGWRTVNVLVRKPIADDAALVAALVENGQRAELDPIEEARAIRVLRTRGLTQGDIASKIGRSTAHISMRLALLTLSVEEQEEVRSGVLGVTRAVDKARTDAGRPVARGVTADRAWHFAHTHALALNAEARCKRLGHKKGRRVSGGMACGECWESVIRADERDHLHERAAITGSCGICGNSYAGKGLTP